MMLYKDSGKAERMSEDICNDNRFEVIEKYRQKLIESTNINTSPDEMAVLDRILFHFWQMGWLDKLEKFQSAQQWIPVTDHLPDEDVSVLVTDDAGGVKTIDVDICYEWEITGERFWATSQNVTAWMPLPKSYGGEQ